MSSLFGKERKETEKEEYERLLKERLKSDAYIEKLREDRIKRIKKYVKMKE